MIYVKEDRVKSRQPGDPAEDRGQRQRVRATGETDDDRRARRAAQQPIARQHALLQPDRSPARGLARGRSVGLHGLYCGWASGWYENTGKCGVVGWIRTTGQGLMSRLLCL